MLFSYKQDTIQNNNNILFLTICHSCINLHITFRFIITRQITNITIILAVSLRTFYKQQALQLLAI